jgi:hypothetical protein
VVQHHHLLDGGMTLISWNGGPIFRNGAVGTEQACCCDQPPPPPPCEPCEDCEFPASQYEQGNAIECFGQTTLPSTKAQDIFLGLPPGGLPSGLSWKAGYPAAIELCTWAFVIDSLSIECCYENCIINGVQTNAFGGKTRNRYRLLLLTCPDGPESATITDISSDALDGVLDLSDEDDPAGCPDPPVACTDWFEYYPDPEPVCNEFP